MKSKQRSIVQRELPRASTFIAAIAIFLAFGSVAFACNVPVFRFALERWRPDPYRFVVVHRDSLTAEDRTLLGVLEEQQEKAIANLLVRELDLNAKQDAEGQQRINVPEGDFSTPQLVVKYPEHLEIEKPVFKGDIRGIDAAKLIESPVRKELVKRLVEGQAAIWLFLESGDPAKDDPAAALVESEIKKLEQDLKLPELSDSPDDVLLTTTPLRLAFSMLRVRRDDPAEETTVQMLLHSEPDLADRLDPLVFPVFGRGRALFPLVGAGITKANIVDAATFLVGPCSCQVKEQNPGFDLLLAADWEKLLSLEGVELTAVVTDDRASKEIELVPIPSGSAPSPAPAHVVATEVASQAPKRESDNQPSAKGSASTDGLNTTGKVFVSILAIAGIVMAGLLFSRR